MLTLGEIRKGIALLPAGWRRVKLEAWLDADLVVRFAGRILPIDASPSAKDLATPGRRSCRPVSDIPIRAH